MRIDDDTEYKDDDRAKINIIYHEIFEHETMQIYYTTYDTRMEQDSITMQHPDIMLLSDESPGEDGTSPHPFWYARVLGKYHVMVRDLLAGNSAAIRRLDFVWVRWLGLVAGQEGGWKSKPTTFAQGKSNMYFLTL